MITVNTKDPKGLLTSIRKEIDGDKIRTWSYDGDGDFTHTPPQWKGDAWLRPSIPLEKNKLVFKIMWPKNSDEEKSVSGVYQGRFIEMLSDHFPESFSSIDATVS